MTMAMAQNERKRIIGALMDLISFVFFFVGFKIRS